MSNNDNNIRDWKLNVDMSGLNAPTGGTNVPQGYYRAKVDDMYIRPENKKRMVIRLRISEGPCTGAIRTTGINLPEGGEDKVRYYWRGLSESVGYGPNDLDNGALELEAESFLGKTAHIFYTPKELSTSDWDKVDFLPPTVWEQKAAGFTPSESAPVTSSNTAPASSSGGGTTTNAAEVRKTLGI